MQARRELPRTRTPVALNTAFPTAAPALADYLGIDIERVTDEAHFRDEFDMDDCLELMILIEDAFTGVEITDDDADQIEVVGDLIRHIDSRLALRRLRSWII